MKNNIMEQPIYTTLPLHYQPQQNDFVFEEDKIKFSSKFDSGNLQNVEKTETNEVLKKKKKLCLFSLLKFL